MLPDPSPTVVVDGLTLRPLEARDEVAARDADLELHAEGVDFLLGRSLQDYEGIREGFARDARGEREAKQAGTGAAAGTAGDRAGPAPLPASFYAVVDEAGDLVGRIVVRWELDDALRHLHGHVGYAVRPEWRRLGHATRLLHGALTLLAARGVGTAVVTCAEANVGSAAVIRTCGGVLRDRVTAHLDGAPLAEAVLRFDVPTAPLPPLPLTD